MELKTLDPYGQAGGR